jgi:putative phosphoesterase
MFIGVISDTHGFFDPQLPRVFEGVGHILHAGDVGSAFVTFQLVQIAPVTAVLGNSDSLLPLKETETVELESRKYLLHHIVEHPRALAEPLRSRVARERPDVVVFGHTHKAFSQMFDGVLYFNPGYAGKPRAGLDRTVAILESKDGMIRPRYVQL